MINEYRVETKQHKNKQKYITHLRTSNGTQAWLIYRGYNIGVGFKKRLLVNNEVIRSFGGGK